MALELVTPDMRIVRGSPCIYHLGLAVLYSEDVKTDGDMLEFDPERTVCMTFGAADGGKQQVNFHKGFGPNIPLAPTFLRIGRNATIVSDCSDANIIALCRKTLGKIVLAGPGTRIGGETVH